jgi:hypothetical protein
MLRHPVIFGISLTMIQLAAFGQQSPTCIEPGVPSHLQDFQNAADGLMNTARRIYSEGIRASQSTPRSGSPTSPIEPSIEPHRTSNTAPLVNIEEPRSYADYWMPIHIEAAQRLAASAQFPSLF